MPKKTPPFPSYPTWTTSKFWSFVRAGLRNKWTRWPPRYHVLAEAKRKKPPRKTGRHIYEFKCTKCKKWWPQKDVQVDHIIPVGSLNKFDDLPGFVERLFCSKDKLRVLCKTCHKKV